MAAIKALVVSCAISAVWYALEFEQFGELQWNRKCDRIVWRLWHLKSRPRRNRMLKGTVTTRMET